MSSIKFPSEHRGKPITVLYDEDPAALTQSLLDVYMPPGSDHKLLVQCKSEGEERDDPAISRRTAMFFWPGEKIKAIADIIWEGIGDGPSRELAFSIRAEGSDRLFDVQRYFERTLSGALAFRCETTRISESQRGKGVGTQWIDREITWVREQSHHPESHISLFATRLGEPPGQFVWRKFFDFENEDIQTHISEKYSIWVNSNITKWAYVAKATEDDVRKVLPASMEHPWSLNACELPPLLMEHFTQKALKEGYPGNDIVAWSFWNSDGLHADGKGLGWEGIRYVNRPWHGPT